jgi:hypothetical protein
MITYHCAIVSCSGFIEFDTVVLDTRSFQLLGYSLFHIPRGLAYFELPRVRSISDRIGVNAWPSDGL